MTYTKTIAASLVAFVSLTAPIAPTHAAIDRQNLGAKYDATNSNIIFRVYSSPATRIELDVYAVSYGAPEVAKYVLTEDANDVWSVTVPVSALQAAGINGLTPFDLCRKTAREDCLITSREKLQSK
jgi:isoamylase